MAKSAAEIQHQASRVSRAGREPQQTTAVKSGLSCTNSISENRDRQGVVVFLALYVGKSSANAQHAQMQSTEQEVQEQFHAGRTMANGPWRADCGVQYHDEQAVPWRADPTVVSSP